MSAPTQEISDSLAPGGSVLQASHQKSIDTLPEAVRQKLPSLSSTEHNQCVLLFIWLGCSAMFFWNAILNTLFSIVATRYPEEPALATVVTNTYTTAACITALVLSYIGANKPIFHYSGGILLASMSLIYPIGVTALSGKTGLAFMYSVGALGGIAEMLYQVSGYALAVIMPRPYGGWVSFGYGICGICTFLIWELLSQVLFPLDKGESNVKKALWIQFVIGTVVITCSTLLYRHLMSKPYMKQALKRAEVSRVKISSAEGLKPATRNYWHVFRQTWQMQAGMALLMGMTMFAHPMVGPYQWHLSVKRNDILTGLFSTGDFAGRYLPNMFKIGSWFLIPSKYMLPLTLLRGILIFLYILIAKYSRDQVDSILTKYWVEVLITGTLAITHGWYASIFMTRVPDNLSNPADKSKAGAIAICLLVLSIAVGMALSKVVQLY